MLYIILMHISHFMFLSANDLLLAVCFIHFSLGILCQTKTNLNDFFFLLNFKVCCKVVEIACNINNTVGPGTINEFTVQWWFKRFCRGDKSLEDEERSGLHFCQKLTVTNGEQSLKLILLQLHEKCTCPMYTYVVHVQCTLNVVHVQ